MVPPSIFSNLICSNNFAVADGFAIAGILLLILFSAFFSASETAFSRANPLRIKSLADEKIKGARRATYICDNYDKALSTILVGNNLVNIASTTLCAYLLTKFILNATLSNLLNTVVMTIVILIFGEILPKGWAKSNPENVALKLSSALYVVMKITYVFCLPFIALQKIFLKKNSNDSEPTVTEDELESIVETMEDEGVIDEQNADMIFGALKLNDISVKDIMTPRVDVVCASINSSIDDIKNIFMKYQYSRIPIYKKSKDNIVGILNQKDFFSAIIGKDKIKLEQMITPALFVSKSTKINNVMKLMQKEKKHMAVVSDEYGGTSGIVTMEDCFEEVFGEVYDEHDDGAVTTITKIDENKYKINASLSVEEVFDYLQIEKMPKNRYSSIASLAFSTFLSAKIF